MPKLSELRLLGTDDADFEVIVDITNYEKYCVQLNYSTGTSTEAHLEASLNYNPDDGSGDWTPVADSEQTLDNTGGVHMWNVSSAIYPWLKIVVDGDSLANSIYFAGDAQPRRG